LYGHFRFGTRGGRYFTNTCQKKANIDIQCSGSERDHIANVILAATLDFARIHPEKEALSSTFNFDSLRHATPIKKWWARL